MKKIIYSSYLFIILFVIAEIILRYKNYKPITIPESENKKEIKSRIDLIKSIFKPHVNHLQVQNYFLDTLLTYEYAGKLKYSVKKRQNGSRYAGAQLIENLPSINLYGCSFTFGIGLNDTQTCAFYLQKGITKYNINNFGIAGAGMVDIYDKIISTIDSNTKVIIINYAYFQTDRMPNSRFYSKMKRTGGMDDYLDFMNSYITINYYSFSKNDNLVRNEMFFPKYRILPLQKQLALINFLDDCYSKKYERWKLDKLKISYFLLKDIFYRCKQKHIELIISNIDGSKNTNDDLIYFSSIGIRIVDFKVDNSELKYNLLPLDGHPNELANKLFAKKIISEVKNYNLVF